MKSCGLSVKCIVLLSLAAMSITFAGCGDGSSAGNSSNADAPRIYETIAEYATLTAVDDDAAGNSFHLSLGNVPDEFLYFTDRPVQETGFDTVANVIDNIWPKVYAEIAPNALITATMPDQEKITLFGILSNPVYDETGDELSFTLTRLDGRPTPDAYLALTDAKLIILNNATTDQIEWSQILTGDAGAFEPTATTGTYVFRMENVIGSVLSYTSAPGRQAMTLAVKAYIQNWNARFGNIPPNASISYDAHSREYGGVQIVTLTNPIYDEQTDSIDFTATALYGFPPIGQDGLTVGHPSLFVDGGASDGLAVTLVNNSGRTAYIKFTGEPLSVNKNNIAIEDGKSDTFSLVQSQSGRIYISYDKKLSSDKPDGANALDNDYHARFDKVELTYVDGAGKANLTAVDFYAIPMILETSIEGTTIERLTLADNQTGEMIKSGLSAIMTDPSLAIVKNEAGTETVRMLSPVKSPGAYHSFDDYLNTLPGAQLTIAGTFFLSKPAQPYAYKGQISADAIILSEGSDTIKMEMQSLRWNKTDTQNHNGIYTCNSPYTVNDQPAAVGDNDLYAAVYRDLMTGFNLGYVKPGDNDSATWWDSSATPFQGTSNSYAKTIADNYPGAYGFPFTDRYNHILADLGGKIDTITITLLDDATAPPPYQPDGILNPQTGDTTFNLILQTPEGSGFKGMVFTFNTHAYAGASAYTFPTKNNGSSGSDDTAQVNQVPAQNGVNIYQLDVLDKSYTVVVKVAGGEVSWGSITGGASATWGAPNLFLGL